MAPRIGAMEHRMLLGAYSFKEHLILFARPLILAHLLKIVNFIAEAVPLIVHGCPQHRRWRSGYVLDHVPVRCLFRPFLQISSQGRRPFSPRIAFLVNGQNLNVVTFQQACGALGA